MKDDDLKYNIKYNKDDLILNEKEDLKLNKEIINKTIEIKKDNYVKIYYNNIYDTNPYNDLSDQELEARIAAALKANRARTTSPQPIPIPPVAPSPSPLVSTPQVQTPVTPVQPVQQPTTVIRPIPNPGVQNFLNDMFASKDKQYFRGWILPDGQMISQFNLGIVRQDHGALAELFMNGLEEYDKALYDKMIALYEDYRAKNSNSRDIFESFAVDALGWIQVSEFGSRRIISRGERWQDRLIAPFIIDYGFDLRSSDNPNQGQCYNSVFIEAYQYTQEILTMALNKISNSFPAIGR